MSTPRLEVDLAAIGSNTATLVHRLSARGIGVTAITKAVLGAPEIAAVMRSAGVAGLGDARVANLRRLRAAERDTSLTLIRSPMLGDAEAVVEQADVSLNTETATLAALSRAATTRGVTHGIVLMVELGDLREGIMPAALEGVVRRLAALPNLRLHGVGTNLACHSGVVPDAVNMAALDAAVEHVERLVDAPVPLVSGGNSTALGWASRAVSVGRVNDLRLGEAILLGRDPLDRSPIPGLDTGAFVLIAEVIESARKPVHSWGTRGRSAFGVQDLAVERQPAGDHQAILAVGRQDVDPEGIEAPEGIAIVGASSDHLVVRSAVPLRVGQEVAFAPDYSALLRAMTSPFVSVTYR